MSTDGLQGVEELMTTLNQLPEQLQRKVMLDWTLRHARSVATAAKAAAPRGPTGNLQKGISVRRSSLSMLRKLNSIARAVVIGKKPAYHFHWINRGTANRFTRGGKFTGRIRGNPFLERSAQPIVTRARSELRTTLAAEVQRMLDRAVKRTLRNVR